MHIYWFITTLQGLAGDEALPIGGGGKPVGLATAGPGLREGCKVTISSSMEAINTSLTLDTYVHASTYIHTYKNICPSQYRECFQRTECVSETHKKGKTEEFSFQFCFDWNKINSAPLNFYTPGDFIQNTQGDFTPCAGGGGWKRQRRGELRFALSYI